MQSLTDDELMKTGDDVKCINNFGIWTLREGHVYRVLDTRDNTIRVQGKFGLPPNWYKKDRFVKIKEGDEPVDFADVLASQYQSVRNNAKLSAMAMAVCFTDYKWFRPILTRHFLKNIEPIELLNFSTKMIAQADYKNFTLSIALMNSNRVTKANPVEKIKA